MRIFASEGKPVLQISDKELDQLKRRIALKKPWPKLGYNGCEFEVFVHSDPKARSSAWEYGKRGEIYLNGTEVPNNIPVEGSRGWGQLGVKYLRKSA